MKKKKLRKSIDKNIKHISEKMNDENWAAGYEIQLAQVLAVLVKARARLGKSHNKELHAVKKTQEPPTAYVGGKPISYQTHD